MANLIGKAQVAEMFSVSIKTIDRWVHLQTIPFLRINGSVRFDPDHLERWIKSKRVSPKEVMK